MNQNIKKLINNDTKNELDQKMKKSFLWNGLKQWLTKSVDNNFEFKDLTPNDINDFYVSIFSSTAIINPGINSSADNYTAPSDDYVFTVPYVTPDDLLIAWKGMKTKQSKSVDIYQISMNMINTLMMTDAGRSLFVSLFNKLIANNCFPDQLKVSKNVPIPKTPQAASPSDFRSISFQPHLAKFFEKCIFLELYKYIESASILSKYQFGFRRGHST